MDLATACNMDSSVSYFDDTVVEEQPTERTEVMGLKIDIQNQNTDSGDTNDCVTELPKKKKPDQKLPNSFSESCEFGIDCGNRLCTFQHVYNYCERCKKHDSIWRRVGDFFSLPTEQQILHVQHHKGSQYHSCWQRKICGRRPYEKTQCYVMVCKITNKCQTGIYTVHELASSNIVDYKDVKMDLNVLMLSIREMDPSL